jgi:hypothetical protein
MSKMKAAFLMVILLCIVSLIGGKSSVSQILDIRQYHQILGKTEGGLPIGKI